MKKVTIQDVAKELKLSRNTVAKALNNSDSVAYETRYMVIKKACEMGYQKLAPAVLNEFKLKNNINDYKTIVVIIRRELSMFWNSIIMGISDEASKNGCRLRLSFVSDDDERDLVLPIEFMEDVDGVIFICVFFLLYVEQINKMNIPIVFLDAPAMRHEIPLNGDYLICESRNSTRILTESLIQQGAKKIGFIGDTTYCTTVKERYEGYKDALLNAKIDFDPSIIATGHKDNRYYKTEEVEQAIASFSYIPEGIVCANDDIALDVIRCLKKRGLSVPDDVAITGFDNVESMTQAEPVLTTVKVNNQKVGKRLVQQLLWRMENSDFPKETLYIETKPIFRSSSIFHGK